MLIIKNAIQTLNNISIVNITNITIKYFSSLFFSTHMTENKQDFRNFFLQVSTISASL